MTIVNFNSGVKSISHVTGMCALLNVKLHYFPKCTVTFYRTGNSEGLPWLHRQLKFLSAIHGTKSCFDLDLDLQSQSRVHPDRLQRVPNFVTQGLTIHS